MVSIRPWSAWAWLSIRPGMPFRCVYGLAGVVIQDDLVGWADRDDSVADSAIGDDPPFRIDGDHGAVSDDDICHAFSLSLPDGDLRSGQDSVEQRGEPQEFLRIGMSVSASSTISPGFITATPSHICLNTARSWL
jgi:hypothetical protein